MLQSEGAGRLPATARQSPEARVLHAGDMQTKTLLILGVVSFQFVQQLLQIASVLAQPDLQPASVKTLGYHCLNSTLHTNLSSRSIHEGIGPSFYECARVEGQCLLKLISKLKNVEEGTNLAICNLGPLTTKPPDIAILTERVTGWQQDVEYLRYTLNNSRQQLASPESNDEKLAMVVSHALELVAMVDFLEDRLSEVFCGITNLGNRMDSNSSFYNMTLTIQLDNSLVEVALAVSLVEEKSVLIFAKNFSFFQQEIAKVSSLGTALLAIARTQLKSSLVVSLKIMELSDAVSDQALQLRKTTDLLKSTVRDNDASAAKQCLQRLMKLVNHKEQQIVSLILLIDIARHSLFAARSSLINITETPGLFLSALVVQVTQFESYRNALLQLQLMTPLVIDHTLNLLVQFESIQRIVDQHAIQNSNAPFSQLEEINDAVRHVQDIVDNVALHEPLALLQNDLNVLTGLNYLLWRGIDATSSIAQEIRLQNGAQLSLRTEHLNLTLGRLSVLAQNILSVEVKDRNIELHDQVGELSTSSMLVAQKVNTIARTIRNTRESSTNFVRRIQETPQNVSESERLLEAVQPQFPVIMEQKVMVTEAVNHTRVSLNDAFDQLQIKRTSLEYAEEIVSSLWFLLDQVSLPVHFSNNTVLTFVKPIVHDTTSSTATSEVFHSTSFAMRKMELTDCVIIQLSQIWKLKGQNIYLTIGVINGSVAASFVYNHPISGRESISLIIDQTIITSNDQFLVEVSRADRNVHLVLHDLENDREYCSSGAISNTVSSFFQAGSVRSTRINLGGASSNIQLGSSLVGIGNFTGCLSDILINGKDLDLWSLAASTHTNAQSIQPCSSSEVTLKDLRLSCNGSEYAWASILQGNLLPLEINFSTFVPTGILMYATSNGDMASSIQVSLINGHVVIKISSSGKEMTLTSLLPYTNGANQFFSLSLSSSQDLHTLTLQTSQEKITKRLSFTDSELQALLNHTDIFLCGVPDDLVNVTGGISNFTGCTALSSNAVLDPLPLNCYSERLNGSCSYCLNEAVLSASFYGASYASFTPVTVQKYFDFGFSFVTSFPNGLLLHSGNASRGLWFDVVLMNGRLELLFGSPFGTLSLPSRTPPLNDSMRHTVVFVVTIGSTIDILIDGSNAGSFPFGSFFPVGTLTPRLSVGGVVPRLEEATLLPAVRAEGFKGCIDHVHVLGQPLDISNSLEAEQVNFKSSKESEIIDVYHFDGGGSYARYDLGRFETDFRLGLQLRTVSSSSLLLYVDDFFALQLVNGEIGLVIAGAEVVGSAVANSNVSNGIWHSVLMRKSGSSLQLLTDNELTFETTTSPQIIGNNSDLFIGGVPNNRTISLPHVTKTGFKGEMRMAYLAHSLLSGGIQHTTQSTLS